MIEVEKEMKASVRIRAVDNRVCGNKTAYALFIEIAPADAESAYQLGIIAERAHNAGIFVEKLLGPDDGPMVCLRASRVNE